MRLIKLTFCLFALTAFTGAFMSGCSQETSEGCKQFYELPVARQLDEFRTYPLETQYEIYSCGMRQEPPDMGLAWEIAHRGESAIPFLVDKLQHEEREARQTDIIIIFHAISQKGGLRNKQDVISLIRKTINSMSMENNKKWNQEMLNEIEKNSVGS